MSIYDDLKPVAAALLKEFKQGFIQHVSITPGTGPADDPGPATETKTTLDATVKGVSFKYMQNGFATAADKTVICAIIDGLVMDEKDFIEIDGERFKIVYDISPPANSSRVVRKFIVGKR